MFRVAGAGEGQPRLARPFGQRRRLRAAAVEPGLAEVVEAEGDLDGVGGAEPALEDRRGEVEAVHEHWRPASLELAFGEADRPDPEPVRHEGREALGRRGAGPGPGVDLE